MRTTRQLFSILPLIFIIGMSSSVAEITLDVTFCLQGTYYIIRYCNSFLVGNKCKVNNCINIHKTKNYGRYHYKDEIENFIFENMVAFHLLEKNRSKIMKENRFMENHSRIIFPHQLIKIFRFPPAEKDYKYKIENDNKPIHDDNFHLGLERDDNDEEYREIKRDKQPKDMNIKNDKDTLKKGGGIDRIISNSDEEDEYLDDKSISEHEFKEINERIRFPVWSVDGENEPREIKEEQKDVQLEEFGLFRMDENLKFLNEKYNPESLPEFSFEGSSNADSFTSEEEQKPLDLGYFSWKQIESSIFLYEKNKSPEKLVSKYLDLYDHIDIQKDIILTNIGTVRYPLERVNLQPYEKLLEEKLAEFVMESKEEDRKLGNVKQPSPIFSEERDNFLKVPPGFESTDNEGESFSGQLNFGDLLLNSRKNSVNHLVEPTSNLRKNNENRADLQVIDTHNQQQLVSVFRDPSKNLARKSEAIDHDKISSLTDDEEVAEEIDKAVGKTSPKKGTDGNRIEDASSPYTGINIPLDHHNIISNNSDLEYILPKPETKNEFLEDIEVKSIVDIGCQLEHGRITSQEDNIQDTNDNNQDILIDKKNKSKKPKKKKKASNNQPQKKKDQYQLSAFQLSLMEEETSEIKEDPKIKEPEPSNKNHDKVPQKNEPDTQGKKNEAKFPEPKSENGRPYYFPNHFPFNTFRKEEFHSSFVINENDNHFKGKKITKINIHEFKEFKFGNEKLEKNVRTFRVPKNVDPDKFISDFLLKERKIDIKNLFK